MAKTALPLTATFMPLLNEAATRQENNQK